MIIKCLVFCAIFFAFGCTKDIEKKLFQLPPGEDGLIKDAITLCSEKSRIPLHMLELIRAGEYEENEAFEEYVYCVCVKTGYADETGHIKVAKAVKLFQNVPGMYDIVTNCSRKEGKNPIETIYKYYKCFQENSPIRLAL